MKKVSNIIHTKNIVMSNILLYQSIHIELLFFWSMFKCVFVYLYIACNSYYLLRIQPKKRNDVIKVVHLTETLGSLKNTLNTHSV